MRILKSLLIRSSKLHGSKIVSSMYICTSFKQNNIFWSKTGSLQFIHMKLQTTTNCKKKNKLWRKKKTKIFLLLPSSIPTSPEVRWPKHHVPPGRYYIKNFSVTNFTWISASLPLFVSFESNRIWCQLGFDSSLFHWVVLRTKTIFTIYYTFFNTVR